MKKKLFRSSLALLACLTLSGVALPSIANASIITARTNVHRMRGIRRRYLYNTYRNRRLAREQARYQINPRFARKFRRLMKKVIRQNRRAVMDEPIAPDDHSYTNTRWFKDGLSKRNLRARSWVSFHESSHRWDVLSYGGVCIGYFQLNPEYLGYRDGHVNLNHKHQVQVADAYVKIRYGSWVRAQRFWEAHDWY